MVETRPREHAERIGKVLRDKLRDELKEVPEHLRPIVLDHVITGLSVGYYKSRSKK